MITAETTVPEIIAEDDLTPAQARYWKALAKKMTGRVNIIDPFRRLHSLQWLREHVGTGVKVYRASTGGKWGKSSQIVTL